MKHATASIAAVVVGLAGVLVFRSAVSDPASSADSAWSPLPATVDSSLTDPLQRRGQSVFQQRCAACHSPVPDEVFGPSFLPPMPGTQALQARYRGALPAALEDRKDLSREFISSVVRNGLPAMPFFRPTEVSKEDLEALAAWLTRSR